MFCRELIESGTTFELEGTRADFEYEDIVDGDDDDDEDVPEEAVRPNPSQANFLETKAEMVQLSCYLYKKTCE